MKRCCNHLKPETICLKIILCMCLSLSTIVCLAQSNRKSASQAKPDFSGKWALDNSKTPYQKYDLLAGADITLEISHREPEIKINRKLILDGKEGSQQLTYYTDARGESNPDLIDMDIVKAKGKHGGTLLSSRSETRWKGDKLIIDSSSRRSMAGGFLEWYTTEEWKLSADGKELTQTRIVRDSTPGERIPRDLLRSQVVLMDQREIKKIFKRISE